MKKIFIIHGRDLAARDALASFLKKLGLSVLDFEEIANDLHQPFVADIVFEGIARADAIVALFTADEHAALYSPDDPWRGLGGPELHETRWQARPNVIFEAGVALGNKPAKTVIVTLGADVELFSDLQGKHIVRLDSSNGPEYLRKRLLQVFEGKEALKPIPKDAGSKFKNAVRKRWEHYDEIAALAAQPVVTMLTPHKL